MGLFNRKPSADPAEVAALRSEIAEMSARLDAAEAAKAELADHLARIDASSAASATTARMDGAKLEELAARVDATTGLAERLDGLAAVPEQVASMSALVERSTTDSAAALERATSLEARLAQVSTELANQLAELGQEIDSLDSRPNEPAAPPTSEVVVEQLREGQVRLANEQARYEIAFREDLATLAEQVRLLRGR